MHFKKLFLAITIVTLYAACNETGNNSSQNKDSSTATTSESREQVLYTQTMDIHNEVMAKMGKLNGYKKQVQQQIDSIKSMLASTDFTRSMAQRIASDLDSLNMLGKKLQTADSSMNAWMEQFEPDPNLPTSDAKADYFEKQRGSAEEMKKQFMDALSEAEKRFKSNK
jgi:hypothetical protein